MIRQFLVISSLIFLSSCSLLNSGTVHVKYTKFTADVDGVTYENKRGLGNVSVSVRNVQHPKEFGKWDFNFTIRPSIHFERHPLGTLATRLNTTTGEQEQIPDFTFRRLSSFANLKLTFHTPIGAFAATAGYGGALRDFDRPSDRDILTTEIRKIDFVYYAFFSKRFFILMGPRYYKEEFEQVTFALRFGYFWGKI
ncbi:MAG: hypothetical protein VX341_11975 [Bdellovibrionota bacterium]|nr:hypothetical protein [Bdellovibrionota bacterium]